MWKIYLCLLTLATGLYASHVFYPLVFVIDPINELEVQGAAPLLRICSARPGCEPTSTYSSGLTYYVTTNELNKKITACLDQDLPHDCVLWLEMAPPNGAQSLGAQPLSSLPMDLVVRINQTSGAGLPMTYRFAATTRAGVIPPSSRIVILTLTDG